MRTRIVPMPAALLALMAVVAVLGVGLFLAFDPGSPSDSGEFGSRQSVSSSANQGAAPIGAPAQQSQPADTAKVAAIVEGREQGPDPIETPVLSTATPEPDIGLHVAGTRELVVDVTQFRQLLPRDAIAPVYNALFMPAESATLPPDELVIGVEINGESKAYPVSPLNFREMVNDTLGGIPILVSW